MTDRWWIDTRSHSAPRLQGTTNRHTAWTKKPNSQSTRYVEVMPVSEHEETIRVLAEEIEALEKESNSIFGQSPRTDATR